MLNFRVLERKKVAEIKEDETKKGKEKEDIDMMDRNEARNKQKTNVAKEDNGTKEAGQNTNNLNRNNCRGVVLTTETHSRCQQTKNESKEDINERDNNTAQKEQTIKTRTSKKKKQD